MIKEEYPNKKFRRGFTLVEIIVASLLLALISAGIFSITLSSRKLISTSQRRHFATQVAQTALENLRAYLGADQWYNASSPIYDTGGWKCYYLTDALNLLNMTTIFGGTEFATKYQGKWCYMITQDPLEYRKAEVMVNWTEIEP